MIVEMLLLVLVAVAVFAYVLEPIVRIGRQIETPEDAVENEAVEEREPVATDGQPVRDSL